MNKTDTYLKQLPEWQKDFLDFFRDAIHEASDTIEEDFKWNVPVFLLDNKLLFAMSAFKSHVKFNFIGNGALLDDPHALFNNGLESKKSRGIDLREGDTVKVNELKALLHSAIATHQAANT